MRSDSWIYNTWTKLKYRVLKRPITLKVVFQRKVNNPRLTVIFLHGIAATSKTWDATLKMLKNDPYMEDVDLFALDLLGFGKSLQANWLDYDYLDYDMAIDNTLVELKVKTPVVVIGHSMGSLIAADYVTNYEPSVKIAKTILVSPPVLMPDELARIPDKVYLKSYGALHGMAKTEPAVDVIGGIVQRFSSFNKKYLKTVGFARSMEQIILNPNNFKTFKQIKIPTVIVHGRFDPLVMASNLKKVEEANPKHVRLVTVTAYHDVSALKRTKILNELKDLLDETL